MNVVSKWESDVNWLEKHRGLLYGEENCPKCGASLCGGLKCLMCAYDPSEHMWIISAAAVILGITTKTVHNRLNDQGIRPIVLGRRARLEWGDLERIREKLQPLTIKFGDGKVKIASPLAAEITGYTRQWIDKLTKGPVSGFQMSGYCWVDREALLEYCGKSNVPGWFSIVFDRYANTGRSP